MNKRLAEVALARAEALQSEARSVIADTNLTDSEKRQRVERINADIRAAVDEARDYADKDSRENEVRTLMERSPALHGATEGRRMEWRSILPSASELRFLNEGTDSAGGYTVPTGVSNVVVDRLTAQSVFLKGGIQVVRYLTQDFTLPHITGADAADTFNEGDLITEGNMTFAALSFKSIKHATIRYASRELLADSAAQMRDVIGNDMIRTLGLKIDQDAFTGLGSGNTPPQLTGLLGQGTTTTLGAGVLPGYDDVADAVSAIEATGGVASVIYASPSAAKNLRKEKATGTGAYLGGNPTQTAANTAWGLPVLVSAHVTDKALAVVDATRVFVGIREDINVSINDAIRWDHDEIGFKVAARFGGICVAEATSVQVVQGG
jgi:HK97 family phage major capsid protein